MQKMAGRASLTHSQYGQLATCHSPLSPTDDANPLSAFAEGVEDCRPRVYRPDDTTRAHTKESLAHEWDRKHPRAELDVGRSERNPYTCLKRAKAGEVRQLLTEEIGWQAQRSRELFMRAQELQNRLKAHRAFGEEVDNDYDSDDNEDQ